MKNVIVIIGGSLASFLLLLLIALGLLSVKPDLFTGQQASAANKQKADSLAKGKPDSLFSLGTDSLKASTSSLKDTTLATQQVPKPSSLGKPQVSAKENANPITVKKAADSVGQPDWKSTAKLIEAMSPEEATKILKQMNDQEVKQILSKLKKRQAGKILAIFEPDRAVKILR